MSPWKNTVMYGKSDSWLILESIGMSWIVLDSV